MGKIDGVFEGGGVKGIGLAGAFAAIEAAGYTFENLAGTSSGSVVASLIAAGYNAAEVKTIIEDLDFQRIMDESWQGRIPLVGKLISLVVNKGIYVGTFFEDFMRQLLAERNIRTFRDLILEDYQDDPRYRYKLQVIASDLTAGRMLILPRDIARFGIDPDDLEVAAAIRMSISIPFFFEPVRLKDGNGKTHYIVDGGVLSNFPVWLFDGGVAEPDWPTFGFCLVAPSAGQPNTINGPISMLKALFSTMMEAHDARYIEAQNFVRTIAIPSMGVHTTDFALSDESKAALYASGYRAATEFLQTWDFETYKQEFRAKQLLSRRERLRGGWEAVS